MKFNRNLNESDENSNSESYLNRADRIERRVRPERGARSQSESELRASPESESSRDNAGVCGQCVPD